MKKDQIPMLLDTHCHLDLYPSHLGFAEKYKNKGIRIITVTNAPCVWEQNRLLFKHSKNIRVALGLHPQLAHQREKEIDLFERLLPKAKYVGEVGLDGTKKFKDLLSVQTRVFKKILKLCSLQKRKILSVHSAGAYKQTIEILGESNVLTNGKVILHWYSGSLSVAKEGLEMGCYFSINPRMTLSKTGKRLIETLPPERILPESDGPFIIIGDHPSEPNDVEIVYQYLSKVWDNSINQVVTKINDNLKRITF